MRDRSGPKLTPRRLLKSSAAISAAEMMMGPRLPALVPARGDSTAADETTIKHGACRSCLYGQCNVLYKVKNNILVGVEGDPEGP